MTTLPQALRPLPELAAIAFHGADAASFLHGQLSTDVAQMPVGAVGLSTYNSAMGRVLASLVLYRRAPDAFVALVAADLAAALRKRLAMFVLRAKVTVTDPAAGRTIRGAAGADDLAAVLGPVPERGQGAATTHGDLVAWPDGRVVLVPGEGADEAVTGPGEPSAAFALHGIRAGVPLVTLATQDQFVPQSLNLDLLGGVNFRKGCYPGQEIVARMQYLGRLKERLFAFTTPAAPPAPGTPLVGAGTTEPALGTVVNAAPAADGTLLLAVAHYDAAMAGTLRLAGADGTRVEVVALPYAVPAPVAPQRVKL